MNPKLDLNLNQAPFLVLWELTRACQLACRHCRAEANCERSRSELTLEECAGVLDDLTGFGEHRPLIVLTGGDPAERPDLLEIIQECRHRGFSVAMTPSGTPRVTRELVRELKANGLERLAISLDAPTRQRHDSFRNVDGSFDWSRRILDWAKDEGLPVQINTTVCRANYSHFNEMAEMVEKIGAVLWSVFFLVPVGRAENSLQITSLEAERIMIRMAELSGKASFDIKSTACPQFRRVLMRRQKAVNPQDGQGLAVIDKSLRLGRLRSYGAINDGLGLLFISHNGGLMPSGFLPLEAGNARRDSIVEVYRKSQLFRTLRDRSLLKGKCGSCDFKDICGGSRARAYASTGDYLDEDPLCLYKSKEFARIEAS